MECMKINTMKKMSFCVFVFLMNHITSKLVTSSQTLPHIRKLHFGLLTPKYCSSEIWSDATATFDKHF